MRTTVSIDTQATDAPARAPTPAAAPRKIHVCYISGLDLRRIAPDRTPFLASLFDAYPWVRITNLPSNELLPTMLTGVYPNQHGVWGVRLKAPTALPRPPRLVDRLPDALTTTAQCLAHLLTNTFDLAAVPPRRRKRFEITRTKYRRRKAPEVVLPRFGDIPSIIGVVGPEKSTYRFSTTPDAVRDLLPRIATGRHDLEVLELYSLDRFQQWNMDRPEEIRRFYRVIDGFLERLQAKCEAQGITLMILSDHGHEEVRHSIDLPARLAALDLRESEYSYFLELNMVRFWFHSQRARDRITGLLAKLEHGRLLSYEDMERYHVPLDDLRYGEVFFVVDAGTMFFPHDFYHPLANLYFWITDPMQRSRRTDPRHRANHGYLPDSPAEQAFAILLDRSCTTAVPHAFLIDIAPTVLELVGRTPPPSMKGRRMFSG